MDISDLVSKMRNAACHVNSHENHLDNGKRFTFNTVQGNVPNAFSINGKTYGCDFNDDAAFYYGEYRIYLNRHLKRLVGEIDSKLSAC